ncbi:MAG: decarboxylase [Chitinophagales bacterium]|nr:decarboxylase [Chitinophagales bacterium]
MKGILYTIIIFSFLSCSNSKKRSQGFDVGYKGALKNIMHKGDLTAKVNLLEFENRNNFYALGAVEDLKGEILILDGEAFISQVKEDRLTVTKSFDLNATLLVYTTIESWSKSEIPGEIFSYSELEKYISKAAIEHGIDIDRPFPFLVEGTAETAAWHVINWKDGDTEHTHEKHINSGLKGSLENERVEILGFYSKNHHGIFTHHSTNMHLHVKSKENNVSGHLDDLSLGKDMILKLPMINEL